MTYAELTNNIAHIVLTLLVLAHVYIAWLIYQTYLIDTNRIYNRRKRGK